MAASAADARITMRRGPPGSFSTNWAVSAMSAFHPLATKERTSQECLKGAKFRSSRTTLYGQGVPAGGSPQCWSGQVSNEVKIALCEAQVNAGQNDFHVRRMSIRGGYDFGTARCVDEHLCISANLHVTNTVRIKNQTARPG